MFQRCWLFGLRLSLYTAAFIAEIVRGGILAVSKGQTEASYALGIRPNYTLRLVIIPQAMRVIIPPLTSQYLNITKELISGSGNRLSRIGISFCGNGIEPGWKRNRDDIYDDDGLFNVFSRHSRIHELVQQQS